MQALVVFESMFRKHAGRCTSYCGRPVKRGRESRSSRLVPHPRLLAMRSTCLSSVVRRTHLA